MKQVAESGVIAAKQAEMQTEAPKKALTLGDLVNGRKGELAKVLPSVLPPDQFCRLALNALNTTKHLKECTPASFYGSLMNCAQLGLKPNVNGEGYLLPYFNGKMRVYECQFIPGYKGLMMLARRSGEIASIDAQTVYENDTFDISYGFEPSLVHKPALGDRGKAIGFYAAVILKEGGKNAYWMSIEDAKKYGKRYSKTFNAGPWQTDFEAMAKKSCLRQVLKMCPCSSDVQKALEAENKYDDNSVGADMFEGMEEVEEPEGAEMQESSELKVDADGVVQETETAKAD